MIELGQINAASLPLRNLVDRSPLEAYLQLPVSPRAGSLRTRVAEEIKAVGTWVDHRFLAPFQRSSVASALQ